MIDVARIKIKLSDNWKWARCEDVIDVRDGTHDTPKYVTSGYPLITSKNLKTEGIDFSTASYISREDHCEISKRSRVDRGDILFAMIGTIGNPVIVNVDSEFSIKNVALFKFSKSPIDAKYFKYLLETPIITKQLNSEQRGGTQKFVSLKVLRNLLIPYPPLEEQRRIAAILDKADAVRRKRQEAIALTEELLRSAFLEMFGDPATNPKGWKKVKFKEIFEGIKYGTSTPPIFEDEGIPFIRATNIKKGTVITNDLKFISLTEAQKIEKCKLKRGDIVIVRSGVNSGDSALITEEYENAYAGYDMIISIKPSLSIFYNYLINDDSGKQLIKPLTRRAAQPHINADQIRNLDFILPPQSLINNFNKVFNCTNLQKQSLCLSLNHLDNLFNSLIQKAFRGEL